MLKKRHLFPLHLRQDNVFRSHLAVGFLHTKKIMKLEVLTKDKEKINMFSSDGTP